MRAAGIEADGVSRFVVAATGCDVIPTFAHRIVIERLLFTGVPQSSQSTLMLGTPERFTAQQRDGVRILLSDNSQQFVVERRVMGDGAIMVRLNVAGLRSYLERNGLTRKFGVP